MHHVATIKAEKIINATGAGDSFNAGVMAALAQERPLVGAVQYGCSVAAARISAQTIPQL